MTTYGSDEACGSCPCLLPMHMFEQVLARGSRLQQAWARRTLQLSQRLREVRLRPGQTLLADGADGRARKRPGGERVIFDAGRSTRLPGRAARREGDPPHADPSVDEAYEHAGIVRDFLREVLERDALDGLGSPLVASVHYGRGLDNAFWNGTQLVYGDGDEDLPEPERLFQRFTRCLDVVAHELCHGVVQNEANFIYAHETGALCESYCDILGSLVKQFHLKQRADEADWLVGAGLFTSRVNGQAVRSLKAPGTAYDDPVLGKDPQTGHMKDFKRLSSRQDHGGVHLNSGISNRAFYVTAIEMGGYAWGDAGRLWYLALRDRLRKDSRFADAAKVTSQLAGQLFGEGSRQQTAVRTGWGEVGVSCG